MTTRAIIRQLVTRAGILFLATTFILVSMNLVTDSRIESDRQSQLKERFDDVLSADQYQSISMESSKEEQSGQISAYIATNKNAEIVGYVVESIAYTEQGNIVCRMGLSADGTTILALAVDDDTPNGAFGTVEENSFLEQFSNARLPCALTIDLPDEKSNEEMYPPLSGLTDGIFRAEAESPDNAGYQDFVEIEVIKGRIERVLWDATQADGGTNRADASVNGEYKLPDNTTIWAAQAYAMENKLIEVQDPAKIAIKATGTTDVVPGVYISVNAFLILANKCIENSKNAKISAPVSSPATMPSDSASNINPDNSQEEQQTEDESILSGTEDGIVKNKEQFQTEFIIDGFPIAEIQTKIVKANASDEISRSVVRTVNLAYRFIIDYRKGDA